MRRPWVVVLILTLLAVPLAGAEPAGGSKPLWPLTIEIGASASFGEYRGGRLHTGIDMRTRGSTGWPVVAVDDGFVSRIKVERRGFGNALYIDHPTLQTRVVYGHLDHFAPQLDAWVAAQRKKHGRRYGYDQNFGPTDFPVKKGQVVAFSGETGMGPPHLHFETRTFGDEPFSPTLKGWVPPDDRPADAVGLHFVPLAGPATVDGQFLAARLPLKHTGNGRWQASRPVRVSGRVGVLAGIVDTSAVGNRFGVETIALSVDGQVQFARKFDRISYTTNKQCPLVYDLPLSEQPGTGYVFTLYRWPWETLPMTCTREPWAGTTAAWPVGEHDLRIDAVDFGGRPLQIAARIVVEEAPVAGSAAVALPLREIGHQATHAGLVVSARAAANGAASTVAVCDSRGEVAAVPLARLGGDRVQLFFPPESRWVGGATVAGVPVLPAGLALVGPEGGTVAAPAAGPVAKFPSGSVYQKTCAFWAPTSIVSGNARLPVRSQAWRLFPEILVTDKPFAVSIPYTASEPARQLAIFAKKPGGGLGCEGGQGGADGRVDIECRWTWPMVVLADTVPPLIKAQADGSFPLFGKCWRFAVTDIGKGIDDDAFKVTVDGRPAEWEYDPDHAMLYVSQSGGKGKGGRRIEIMATDRAGHVSTLTSQR